MWEDVFYGVTEFHNCFIYFNISNILILRVETNFQKSFRRFPVSVEDFCRRYASFQNLLFTLLQCECFPHPPFNLGIRRKYRWCLLNPAFSAKQWCAPYETISDPLLAVVSLNFSPSLPIIVGQLWDGTEPENLVQSGN